MNHYEYYEILNDNLNVSDDEKDTKILDKKKI